MTTPRVTAEQRRALDNLSRGLAIDYGICGRNGQSLLIGALMRKRLIDDNGLTVLGLAVIGVNK